MIPERNGLNLILVTILILTLVLSYCAAPSKLADSSQKHKPQPRWMLRPYLSSLIPREPETADQKIHEKEEETAFLPRVIPR